MSQGMCRCANNSSPFEGLSERVGGVVPVNSGFTSKDVWPIRVVGSSKEDLIDPVRHVKNGFIGHFRSPELNRSL